MANDCFCDCADFEPHAGCLCIARGERIARTKRHSPEEAFTRNEDFAKGNNLADVA